MVCQIIIIKGDNISQWAILWEFQIQSQQPTEWNFLPLFCITCYVFNQLCQFFFRIIYYLLHYVLEQSHKIVKVHQICTEDIYINICCWLLLHKLAHQLRYASVTLSTSVFMFHLISFSPHFIDHVSFLFPSVHSPSNSFHLQ